MTPSARYSTGGYIEIVFDPLYISIVPPPNCVTIFGLVGTK